MVTWHCKHKIIGLFKPISIFHFDFDRFPFEHHGIILFCPLSSKEIKHIQNQQICNCFPIKNNFLIQRFRLFLQTLQIPGINLSFVILIGRIRLKCANHQLVKWSRRRKIEILHVLDRSMVIPSHAHVSWTISNDKKISHYLVIFFP